MMGLGISDVWVDLTQSLSALGTVRTGDLVEIVTKDPGGVIGGTALMEVTGVRPADPYGVALECIFRGCMRPQQGTMLSWYFPESGGNGLLHLCAGGCSVCGAVDGSRPMWHVDTFRIRDPAKVVEPWAALRPKPNVGVAAIGNQSVGLALTSIRCPS